MEYCAKNMIELTSDNIIERLVIPQDNTNDSDSDILQQILPIGMDR